MIANRKPLRRSVLLVTALGVSLGIAGCSTPPWAAPGDSPSATATTTEIPQPVPNDLSTGATARSLTAGPLTIALNYWSTLTMDKWTPAALKPVSLSLITQITPNDGQKVYLQRATMVATPGSATETFDPLSAQVDSATTNPGYLVLDPYSYSQTFNVGPTPDAATYVTLVFTYEFLVQSTPTSSDYAKQTASDTLTVAIAN
jgi:hypothetical protein